MRGDSFEHVTYWNEASLNLQADNARHNILHVYLAGDGIPWHGGRPTADPTASEPLTLDLIALDKSPAVLLGRPCFHGHSIEQTHR